MIGTLRKHSSWLWGIIITATVVSFVFWGSSQSSRSGERTVKINRGRIDGRPVTEAEYRRAEREASLYYFLSTQHWPDENVKKTDFDLTSLTYQQLFLIRKMEEYGVQVDSAAVGQAAGEILRAYGRDKSKPPTLDEFVQGALSSHANADDLERYLRHQLGVHQLREIIGLGGQLITPEQARIMYLRDYQELATDAVFFDSSNFVAAVPAPTSEVITQYFELHQSEYRVPDRVQVNYVRFDATNFLADADRQWQAEATNYEHQAELYYRQRTNSIHDSRPPEEVKAGIRAEMHQQLALVAANRKASEILDAVLLKEPLRPESLESTVITNGMKMAVSEPFDKESGPVEFDGGPDFARASFSLTNSDPIFQQPIVSSNAIFLISLGRTIPSEIPPLDQLRSRVRADYVNNEARLLARRAGIQFAQTATNALAQGKTFVGICAEARVKRVTVPPFSIATRSLPVVEEHLSLDFYKRIAISTPVGAASAFQPTTDSGVVVYVQERLPVSEAKQKEDLPAFVEFLRQRRTQEAFIIWFQREMNKALRDVPAPERKS